MGYPNQYQNPYQNGMNPMTPYNMYSDRSNPANMQMPPYNTYPDRMNQPNMQIPQGIIGRIVNDFSEITANDVPMNGNAAFFPKSDGTELQVRSWTSGGTIQTVVYRPVIGAEENGKVEFDERSYFESLNNDMKAFRDELSERFDNLEKSLAGSAAKTTKTSGRAKKEATSDE